MGKKWSITLVHLLSEGDLSFNDLARKFDTPVNQSLLSSRLKEMIKLRLTIRKEVGDSVSYGMTKEGQELLDNIHNIRAWARRCNYCLPVECNSDMCKYSTNRE